MIGLLGSTGWIGSNVKKALEEADLNFECVSRKKAQKENIRELSKYKIIINCIGGFTSKLYDNFPRFNRQHMDINRSYREKLVRTLNRNVIVNFYSNQSYCNSPEPVDVNFDGYTSPVFSPCLNENLLQFKNPNEIQIICSSLFDSEANVKNILFQYLVEDEIPSPCKSYCSIVDMAKNTASYVSNIDLRKPPAARLHFTSDVLVDGHEIKLMIEKNYELRDKKVLDWQLSGSNLRSDMTKERFSAIGAEHSFGSAKEQIEQCFIEMKGKIPNDT